MKILRHSTKKSVVVGSVIAKSVHPTVAGGPAATLKIFQSVAVFSAFLLSSCTQTPAFASTPEYFNKVVTAIGRAENSVKYPYGIKSIPTNGDKDYARKICYNSVRNNYRRWVNAGKPEDFISFMSRRYCPIGAPDDPNGLNKNWVKNVRAFLNG